jgi:hypothetical protein
VVCGDQFCAGLFQFEGEFRGDALEDFGLAAFEVESGIGFLQFRLQPLVVDDEQLQRLCVDGSVSYPGSPAYGGRPARRSAVQARGNGPATWLYLDLDRSGQR